MISLALRSVAALVAVFALQAAHAQDAPSPRPHQPAGSATG